MDTWPVAFIIVASIMAAFGVVWISIKHNRVQTIPEQLDTASSSARMGDIEGRLAGITAKTDALERRMETLQEDVMRDLAKSSSRQRRAEKAEQAVEPADDPDQLRLPTLEQTPEGIAGVRDRIRRRMG